MMENKPVLVISKTFNLNDKTQLNFVKMSDEVSISVNLIEDGKVVAHREVKPTEAIKRVMALRLGESIEAKNGIVTCIEESEEIL